MHEISRRPARALRLAGATLALAAATLFAPLAQAQTYPSKPIRLIVGYPPGGSNDIVARIVAPKLGEALKATVVVENRAGAGGTIGADHVAKAEPDGYTLLFSSMSPVVLTPQTMKQPPFNTLADFTAINIVGLTPEAVAVGPKLKDVKTLKGLLDLARTQPVTLSSSGAGGLPHLTIELLKQASQGKIMHVPYRGAGPAVTDTLAGHVDGIVMDLPPLYSLIKDGRLNALAVTSEERVGFLDGVPTAREALPGFNVVNWLGVFAPAKTPPDVVATLDAALHKVVTDQDVKRQLEQVAVVPSILPDAAAFQKQLDHDFKRWGKVIQDAGVSMSD